MEHQHGPNCGCSHEPSTENIGTLYSLYTKINLEEVECLNEAKENSGRTVFRPWDQRLDEQFVESDADEELLFNIPFTGNVKLKGIIIRGGENASHPAKIRLFKNLPHMTFDDVVKPADQEFHLAQDANGTIEYATKIVTFSSVHHLTLHFPSNYGAESTKIYYIGLKGDWHEGHKHGVTICTYEATPSIADHKDKLTDISVMQLK